MFKSREIESILSLGTGQLLKLLNSWQKNPTKQNTNPQDTVSTIVFLNPKEKMSGILNYSFYLSICYFFCCSAHSEGKKEYF
jgi:hypothetical protein